MQDLNSNEYELLNIKSGEWRVVDGVLESYNDYKIKEKNVHVPDGVLEISSQAFDGSAIKSIHIPKSVKTICSCAFQDSSLESIYIDDPDIYLEKGCLYQILNLKNVYIGGVRYDVIVTQYRREDSNEEVYCLERYLGKAEEYTVDDDITVICGGAFYNCDTLKRITLPESVEEIEIFAFSADRNNTIEQVVLPNSLKIIGYGAFSGCDCIDELIVPKSVEYIDDNAFAFWGSGQKIYMPSEFKGAKLFQSWRKDCEAKIIYYDDPS